MRRLLVLLTTLLLLSGVLGITASAESAASSVDMYCTVNSEGDCLVRTTVMIRLEGNQTGLTYPLPVNATGITMNGSAVATRKTDNAVLVDISRITDHYVGETSLVFDYTIPDTVKPEELKPEAKKLGMTRRLQLTLPMLCGFEYPVEKFSFVITMPSDQMTNPAMFHSTYRQDSVLSDLDYTPRGTQLIGSSKVGLNDHEGMTMTMIVPQEMFPTVSTYVREGNPELVPMLICCGLALLYWLIFLRTLPLRRSRASTAPEGITAGELGCRVTLCGGDLTMMVFSWAQLGYLLIHMDDNGRVLLHKRMDMGNERNQFENKVFKALFGSRRVVDATGMQYAKLVRKVMKLVPSERNMYKGNSGNVKIFRGLACGSQIFCGICVAMNMTAVPALQVLMSVILSVFGAISAWLIQDIAYRTHLRGKVPVYIGLVCVLIWILLGVLCGQVWIPLGCALGQWAIGYFAAYGGRRSDLGRHDAGQVLGLRSYLKHLPREEIGRLMANDPDYFFNNAPYALAMGVINPYARAFGRRKLDQCPYLYTRVSGKRTAEEWGHLMADAADLMDYKSRRMQIERWTAIQISTKK